MCAFKFLVVSKYFYIYFYSEDFFLKKSFSWRDIFFWAKVWGGGGGGVLYGGTNDPIMPMGNFTNAFSSSLNTVNLKIFFNHCEVYT